MKEIILITPSLGLGGIQKSIVTLANYFSENNIKVNVYSLVKRKHFFRLDENVIYNEPKSEQKQSLFQYILSIRALVKRNNCDNVLVFGKFQSALTMLALVGTNKRIFISDRASPLYRDIWHIDLFTRFVFYFLKPTGVIAQTNISSKYQLKRFGPNVPICVIPNAVHRFRFKQSQKNNHVLVVGRFNDKLKGHYRLLDIWKRAFIPGWKLVFAGGDESDDSQLLKIAKEFAIYDSLVFLGKVDNLDEIYNQSKIFVLPSISEGYPNALCEAMAAGLACISFDILAGPSEIIESNVNGLLVEDNNIELFAEKLKILMTDNKLALTLGENAKKIADTNSIEIIGKKFSDFIFSKSN